jgi:hypothetical protein
MKSIWSKDYIKFKDSNFLEKLISHEVNKINRPTNLDLTKTKSDIIKETQITKRKLEPDSQFTNLSKSSVLNSDYATNLNENKYSDAIKIKRSKIEEIIPYDPDFLLCKKKIKNIVL